MYGPLKLIHHQHSGRLRPHEHTSYAGLFVLIVIAGFVMLVATVKPVSADHPGPQAGSIGLNGQVPAAPPKTGAVITSPTNLQHFPSSPIKVSGTCPVNTLVEIFKNNIFAGSSPCDDGGKFSLQVDLLYGENSLTAQDFDNLNQAGPMSAAVLVFYDAVPPSTDPLALLNFNGTQLLLDTDSVYRGTFPMQTLNVPITIIGGTAPFAINVSWGDANNNVIPRNDNTVFNASHVYKRAGTYQITLQGGDSEQRVAFLTVAAIVNGQPSVLGATNGQPPATNKLLMLWPLYAIVVTLVGSFWLGERREKKILGHIAAKPVPTSGMVSH